MISDASRKEIVEDMGQFVKNQLGLLFVAHTAEKSVVCILTSLEVVVDLYDAPHSTSACRSASNNGFLVLSVFPKPRRAPRNKGGHVGRPRYTDRSGIEVNG